MLLQVIICLLAIASALVLLLGLAVVIYYCMAVRRFAGRLDSVAQELEVFLETRQAQLNPASQDNAGQEPDCIPPMRIHLESDKSLDDAAWLQASGQRCSDWLESQAFVRVGNFVIEELGDERLRIFLSEDGTLIASLRWPAQADEPYLEFCFQLLNGESGGVANPPEATLPLSEDAIGRFFAGRLSDQPDLPARMLAAAKSLAAEHVLARFELSTVPLFYEEAHATEMDLRLSKGGVTREEIEHSLLAQGLPATKSDIERVQNEWQDAIEKHLLDFSSLGLNQVYSGESVMIVYDGSVDEYLVRRLKEILLDLSLVGKVSREEVEQSLREMRELLATFTPREAVARLRPMLPEPIRYHLVDQLDHPLEAEVYVLPKR